MSSVGVVCSTCTASGKKSGRSEKHPQENYNIKWADIHRTVNSIHNVSAIRMRMMCRTAICDLFAYLFDVAVTSSNMIKVHMPLWTIELRSSIDIPRVLSMYEPSIRFAKREGEAP